MDTLHEFEYVGVHLTSFMIAGLVRLARERSYAN